MPNNASSFKTFVDLIESGEVIRDEDYTTTLRLSNKPGIVYRNVKTGHIYYQPSGLSTAIVPFTSFDAIQEALVKRTQSKHKRRKHSLHDFITDTTSYFRYSDLNALTIEKELDIKSENLDRSFGSLTLIKDALVSKPITTDYLSGNKELFYAISNYLGDIIYSKQGHWTYTTDSDGQTLLPSDIQIPGKSSYNWFRDLVGIFVEKRYDQLVNIVKIATQS